MVNIPDAFKDVGPIPGKVRLTVKAEEELPAGRLVTTGTNEPDFKLADAADDAMGFTQALIAINTYGDVDLFGPVWVSDVDAGSDAISYGDILEAAADGKVKKASATTPAKIRGKALSSASAGEKVQYMAFLSTPDPITT